jgi:hypothetical protein
MSERALMVAGNWRTRAMLDRYVRRDDDALRVALGRVGTVVLGTFGEAKAETRAAAPRSHTVVTTDATASEHADAV